ncbi:MAG: helix-turn-helix transcriptional regulator [Chloroflexi bacterium]|nr:helix-turn-helix transcriptional regulator [Chloroflexota bacterium]
MTVSSTPKYLRLRFSRQRRGIRQYRLAEAIGITPQRLAEVEAGRRQLEPDEYRQAMEFLHHQPILGGGVQCPT